MPALFNCLFFFVTPALAAPLTLSGLLEAVRQHPELRSDQMQTTVSQIEVRSAYSRFAPTLSFAQFWDADPDLPKVVAPFRQQLDLKLNLFRGLYDWAHLQGQKSLLDQSREQRHTKWLEASRKATETYLTCLHLKRSEEEAERALKISRQVVGIERERFQKGVRSRDDLAKLQLDLATSELEVAQARGQHQNCLTQLSYWAGHVGDIEDVHFESLIKNALREPAPQLDARHPDLILAREQKSYSVFQTQKVQSAFFPHLQFRLSHFPEAPYQPSSQQWWLTLEWEIVNASHFQDLEIARVHEQMAEMQQRATTQKLDSQLKVRRAELAQAHLQYEHHKNQLQAVETLLASSLRRFRSGTMSANDITFDQSRVLRNRSAFHQAWLQMNLAWVRYQNARGETLAEAFLESSTPRPRSTEDGR